MKILIAIIIIILNQAYASSECGDLNILSSDKELTTIYCSLESKFQRPNVKFCENCYRGEEIINKLFLKENAKNEMSHLLIKTITPTLIDTFKIGNNKEFEAKSCSSDSLKNSFKKFPKCYENNEEIQNFVKSYQKKLIFETSQIISKSPSYDKDGFFFRNKVENSCNLSDADVLRLNTKKQELIMSPELLKEIVRQINDTTDIKTIEEKIFSNSNLTKDQKNILDHPLIKNILKNHSNELKTFLNSEKNLNNSKIIKWLYSQKNLNSLNQNLNKNCETSFENIAKFMCSNDYQSGNVSILNYKDFEDKIPEKYKSYHLDLYCSQINQDNISLNEIISNATSQDQSGMSQMKDEVFSKDLYRNVIQDKSEELCKSKDQPCTDKKSPQCLLAQDVKEATEKNVSSFDKETIKKLRDILGTDVQADEATRKTLIASGILAEKDFSQTLPAPQTAAAPSPIDPSKEREVMGKVSSPVTQAAQPFAGANINSNYSNFNGSSSNTSTTQEETSESYRERGPVLPPSTAEYLKQMSSMNRELLDRLVKERGAKEKYSDDEIKQQIAKLSQERNLPLSPDQQAQFFDHEWSEAAPKVMPLIPEELKAKDKNSDRYAASITSPLTGKALQDKKYQDQRNKALEQFGKGATDSTPVTDASAVVMSVNNELLLKKVRLDVPDDKIEKLNLSVILDQKLGADKEGKKLKGLIDNKQSFMLDIEGQVAFMVEYSEAKKGFDLKTLKNNLPPEVFEKIKAQLSQFLSKNERKHEYSALKEELKN